MPSARDRVPGIYVGVVLNPLARKNRGEADDRAAALREILGAHGEVHLTRSVDDLDASLEALLPRATHLVSDGGDGALHCLLHAVRGRVPDPAEWPTFLPTNGGTIDFVARKVGIRGRSLALTRALADLARQGRAPEEVSLDSLLLEGEDESGGAFDRLGFALAAGGVGNRFFDQYYKDAEPTPATIALVIARAVSGLALLGLGPRFHDRAQVAREIFRPTRARVRIDGELLAATEHGALHAGAFDVNLGGVVRVFPLARERGRIHLQAGFISPLEMVANLPALAAGGAIRAPGLRDTAGASMDIEAIDEPLRPILDGERYEGLRTLRITPGPRVRIARLRA